MDNLVLRKRTIAVLFVTLLMMGAEIYFGITTHSMGLTADGFHMGCHSFAFLITLIVCLLAIKYKDREEKFNALGGYTSALLLGITSIGIIYESLERFFKPLSISFEEAIFIAVLGLIINLICVLIMGGNNPFHNHSHHHEHHDHSEEHHHEENLNFKAAYMHIIADAFTSILAISALIVGKYFGLTIFDPIVGLLGGIIIAKWTKDLIKSSFKILMDFE